jgi:hypothetical protein
MLSVAANDETETVVDAEEVAILKSVMTGAVVSGRVIVTEADRLAETLPAASLAQL